MIIEKPHLVVGWLDVFGCWLLLVGVGWLLGNLKKSTPTLRQELKIAKTGASQELHCCTGSCSLTKKTDRK